jgi:putative membrane protein
MKKIMLLFLILSVSMCGCSGGSSAAGLTDKIAAKAESPETDTSPNAPATDSMGTTSESISNSGEDPDSHVDPNDIDVDITEKMYVSYINEIYVNTDDYIGKIIRIEGMFQAYTDENTGNIYYYVYRTGPGCCGNDGSMCGFEFTWNGDMPKDNDWVEVVGSLRSYEEDGCEYLTLDAKSVIVMEARGAETVYQ